MNMHFEFEIIIVIIVFSLNCFYNAWILLSIGNKDMSVIKSHPQYESYDIAFNGEPYQYHLTP